ncbi:MAG: hypothetical protein FWE84_02010 [Firmicutes bacterium]|nr:hypothetical protein [Bacillota bacterium]
MVKGLVNKSFVRKFVCLAVAAVMLFSLMGLSGCVDIAGLKGQLLELQKEAAQLKLDIYVLEKGEDNYFAEEWTDVLGFAATGRGWIDTAADKAGVDNALNTAKIKIDWVKTKEECMGAFYTLQEAYDEGFLTVNDLKSIAYYHHEGKVWLTDGENVWEDEEFVPLPKKPETLSAETRKNIKELEARNMNVEENIGYFIIRRNVKVDDLMIEKYYGTYNGCIALKILLWDLNDLDYVLEPWTDEIAGIVFDYSSEKSDGIRIWKQ